MQVKSARFITSLARAGEFPGRGLPEVAMVGKSNVGKSSLINALAGRHALAKVSGAPGKTRLINVFEFDARFFLIDLPGYGFARVARSEKERWAGMIEGYLTAGGPLRLAVQLVDIRHAPTEDDVAMVAYLRHYDIPFIAAATKADKLSRAARARAIPVICRTLGVQPWEVYPVSAQTREGCEALLGVMGERLFGEDG